MVSWTTGTVNSKTVLWTGENGSFPSKQFRKKIFIALVLSLSLLRPFIYYQIIVVAFNLVIKFSEFGPDASGVEFIAFNGPHGTDDWLKFERNAGIVSVVKQKEDKSRYLKSPLLIRFMVPGPWRLAAKF